MSQKKETREPSPCLFESTFISIATIPPDASFKNVNWHIDGTDIIDFDSSTGQITALNPGVATIIASPEKGITTQCKVDVIKTCSQRDYEIMTTEDKALVSCLNLMYAYYEDIGDSPSKNRQDAILNKISEIRQKMEYSSMYDNCLNTDVPSSNTKTTKIDVQTLETLTAKDIKNMHLRDNVFILLASLIPKVGPYLAILLELLRQEEQEESINLLGLGVDAVINYLSAKDKFKWLSVLLIGKDVKDLLSTEGKETYVNDGFRLAEGDTVVRIRLDYDLGLKNIIFDFVVRNDVPVSCSKYGPTTVGAGADGYSNSSYINRESKEWQNEGYVKD